MEYTVFVGLQHQIANDEDDEQEEVPCVFLVLTLLDQLDVVVELNHRATTVRRQFLT